MLLHLGLRQLNMGFCKLFVLLDYTHIWSFNPHLQKQKLIFQGLGLHSNFVKYMLKIKFTEYGSDRYFTT